MEKRIKKFISFIKKEAFYFEKNVSRAIPNTLIQKTQQDIRMYVATNCGENVPQDIDDRIYTKILECFGEIHEASEREYTNSLHAYLKHRGYSIDSETIPKEIEKDARLYATQCQLCKFKYLLPIAAYKIGSTFIYDLYRNEYHVY